MTPAEALRRFEQRLIPVRTVAGAGQALEQYTTDMLPAGHFASPSYAALAQGFHAGYDAAMAQVRRILAETQSESLRNG